MSEGERVLEGLRSIVIQELREETNIGRGRKAVTMGVRDQQQDLMDTSDQLMANTITMTNLRRSIDMRTPNGRQRKLMKSDMVGLLLVHRMLLKDMKEVEVDLNQRAATKVI
jgi:hypothetical protein